MSRSWPMAVTLLLDWLIDVASVCRREAGDSCLARAGFVVATDGELDATGMSANGSRETSRTPVATGSASIAHRASSDNA